MENNFKNIAILIDAENVQARWFKEILEKVGLYGRVTVKRVYADWSSDDSRYPLIKEWKRAVRDEGLMAIQQFRYKGDKNISDFALVIDAMDLLFKERVDCFCLVSGDSDFGRLIQYIKEQGPYCIGFSEKGKAKANFMNTFDEFTELDTEHNQQDSNFKLTEFIERAIDRLAEKSGDEWVYFSNLGIYLKNIKADFHISQYGFKNLYDYLSQGENKNKYELKIEEDRTTKLVRKKVG
ncbi:MAG: NYN domain-containing protein [Spirochaetaceae bacterium]|nr:NYN domain-containing protein [Spirochaetaceae bacterium]